MVRYIAAIIVIQIFVSLVLRSIKYIAVLFWRGVKHVLFVAKFFGLFFDGIYRNICFFCWAEADRFVFTFQQFVLC